MNGGQTGMGLQLPAPVWAAVGALVFLSFGFTEMMGSDLWWHLAAGREILQDGTVWLKDDWSFTEYGTPWNNHEWLSDLIYYGWAALFGVPALVYWKWLVLVATYLCLQGALYRRTGSHPASLIAALAAVALAEPFLDVRPHLYTLLGVSVLLLLSWRRTPRLWELILLFVTWVNLHGGFVFGLMLLSVLVFPWREFSLQALGRAVLTTVIVALACLLNPDGIQVFLLPLVYAFTDSPYRQLGEWLSPFAPGGIQAPLFLPWLVAVPVLALVSLLPPLRRENGIPWEALALTALTLAMALTSRRFIPLLGITSSLLLAPVLAWLLRRLDRWQGIVSPALLVLILAVGILRLLPYPLAAAPAYHYLTAEYSYPHDLLDLVEVNGLNGKLFSYYNWGGYVHWRTDGAMRVFLDGRANTLYDDETYLEYGRVMRGEPGWTELLDRENVDYFLWPRMTNGGPILLKQLWDTGNWKLVYQDARGVLFARNSVPTGTRLQAPPESPYRYLTAAQNAFVSKDNATAKAAARKVLEMIPWQHTACAILASTLRREEQPAAADSVISDCRAWFPTAFLR